MSVQTMPSFYLTHGGGPLPLLGHESHTSLIRSLKQFSSRVARPRAILLVSAHWEEHEVHVSSAAQPRMVYDYYGFPPEAYEIKYSAPGDPALADTVSDLLGNAGISHRQSERGFDHGAFVPLTLMYPAADIPVVTLSLLSSMDAQAHINVGKALAPLRDEGVMIIGSGSSFHNMKSFMQSRTSNGAVHESVRQSEAFNDDLVAALANGKDSTEQRTQKLAHWEMLSEARHCHPREEHLLPLMVAFGAGGCSPAKVIFDGDMSSFKISSFRFD